MIPKKNLHSSFNLAPLPYHSLDAKGKIITVNQFWLDTLGYKRSEVEGRWFGDFLVPDSATKFKRDFPSFKISGQAENIEFQMKHKEGFSLYMLFNGIGEYDKNGKFLQTHCFFTNITEQKLLENKLRTSEEKSRLFADNCADAIWVLDSRFQTTFVSPSVKNLLGYSVKEAMSLPQEKLLSPESLAVVKNDADRRLKTEKSGKKDKKIKRRELEFIRKDGSTVWTELVSKPLYDKKGQFSGFLETIRDISDRKKLIEELKSERFKLREFYENLPLLVYSVGLNGKIFDCNRQAVKILGYKSKKELIGQSIETSVYAPSSRKKAKKLFQKWKETGKLKNEELQIITKQGKIIDVLLNVDTIYDEDGTKLFSISTHLDVTERKLAEQELHESEERFRDLVDHSFDLICTHDLQGKLLWVNPAGEKLIGYNAEQLIGTNLRDYLASDFMYLFDGYLTEIERKGVAKGFLQVLTHSGEKRIWEYQNSLRVEGVRTPIVRGTARDVTEQQQAEAAQQENKERYKELANSIADVFFAMDKNLRFTYWNEASAELTGKPAEEAVGKTFYEVYPMAKGTTAEELFLKTLKTQQPQNAVQEAKLKGEHRFFWIKTYPSIHGLTVFLRDITERKQSEKSLKESEEKYRELFENSNDGIFLHDLDGTLLDVNQETLDLFGYTKTEFLSLGISDLYPQEEVKKSKWAFGTINKNGFVKFEIDFRKKTGKIFPVELSASLFELEGKQIIQSIARDITVRKKTEEELQASEKKYREIVELSPDMIMTIDLKGRIASCNEIVKETTGFSREEIAGRHITKLPFVRAKDSLRYLKIFTSILKGKVPAPFEAEYKHRDGSNRIAEIRASLMKINKKIVGIQAIGTDITDRKKADTEMLASREQLRNLTAHLQSVREEERMGLAREIHDELGQALTAIKIDAYLIHKFFPQDQEPQLKRTQSMIQLIDSTIENVKKIASKLRPSLLDDFGLIAALEWQAREFQQRTGIICKLSIGSENIQVNKEHAINLYRIFQEALTNVARHAQATKLNISLKKQNGWIRMKIKDNGKGITEPDISDSKSYGMLGIKERVEFMKGKVKIYGVKNEGTTLEVRIPYRPGEK